MSRELLRVIVLILLLGLSIPTFGSVRVKASASAFIEPVYSGLNFPVAFTFAPDGRIFYNEKNTGHIRVIQNGDVLSTSFATIGPLPAGVGSTEEGLLGITLDPDFNTNHFLYVYWTKWDGTKKHSVITKFTASGNTNATDGQDIFDFIDPNPGPTNHNGGYMKFGPDGKLYVEIGDFCAWDCNGIPLSQRLTTYAGKILRMNPDGTLPTDNPTIGDTQHRLIWAYGYRNGFGMDFSSTGKLIATMAGPNCCDRIFFVSNSSNFGWPICGTVSQPACLTPYTPSIFQTGPTVTPTGITWYSSNPGILYFGEHNTGDLMQLIITPSGPGEVSKIFSAGSGILAVERALNGSIYFSTDAGNIYHFIPPPLTLSLTPNSPANGTVLDNALPDLQIRATINNANVPGVNLTIFVNGTQVCAGQSDTAGLFGCNFQVTMQGTYYWNATMTPTPMAGLNAHFTVGLLAGIQLVNGWNLISLPLVPANSLIGKVFAAQIANSMLGMVWSYQQGAWKFSNGGVSGTLATIQDGFGYWVYMAHSDTLYVTGSVIPSAASPPAYSLSAGWNLLGFKPEPTLAPETVGTSLTSIAGDYNANSVWIYDNPTGTWIRASGSTLIPVGEALWVYMTTAATLRP